MKHLYAPWRSEYFNDNKDNGCVFCDIIKNTDNDTENGVLWRGKDCLAVLNKYPYSPGHFMIIPYSHVDGIEQLTKDAWIEISCMVLKGVTILKNELNAQGVNIGMNLGAAAGAGIAEHVHYHLVPRWVRDTNFITTIGNTRVCGSDLNNIYKQLRDKFSEF